MIQTCEPSRAAPRKETADERACPSRSHRQYQHCRNHSAHYSRPNHTPLCVVRVMRSSHANAPTHARERERTNERQSLSISAFRFSQFSQRLALLLSVCCSLPCCCCCVVVVALPPGSSSRHQRRCALTMVAQSPREIASDCGGSSSPVAVSSSECVEQQQQPRNISMAVDHQRPPPAPQPTTSTLAVAPAATVVNIHSLSLSKYQTRSTWAGCAHARVR